MRSECQSLLEHTLKKGSKKFNNVKLVQGKD